MTKVRDLAAWLLALPLLVFGGNYFLQLFELPPGDGSAGDQLLQSMRDGGLMAAIAFSHVIVAVALMIPRTRFAGALLQLPMSLGILAFHGTMLPEGTLFALVLVTLNVLALGEVRRWRRLLTRVQKGE